MSNDSSTSVSCVGLLPTLLVVLFVGLKLTGYIDWSWLWVLSPIWISIGLGLFVAVLVIILAFIVGFAQGIIKAIKEE